jgi:F420-dependent oxidoreductase-like protein
MTPFQTPFFGYHMPSFSIPGATDETRFEGVVSLACAAEEAGFDMVTVMDHFYQIGVHGSQEEPMLEAYATLSALAARTSRVMLGTMVSGVTYRNPALLAKTVTTLDTISRGRAVLGLGAAWNEEEHTGYDFEFPPIGERMGRLEEALQICKLMFTEEKPSFEGRYYQIHEALNFPRPIQPGGPPILIGGSGERKTLRYVARYGDMSNWWGPMDDLKHYSEVLDQHCEAEGRDPTTILRTIMSPVVLVADQREAEATLGRLSPERRSQVKAATPAEAAEALQPYLEAGFGGFIFRNTTMLTPEAVGLAGELMRLMR